MKRYYFTHVVEHSYDICVEAEDFSEALVLADKAALIAEKSGPDYSCHETSFNYEVEVKE